MNPSSSSRPSPSRSPLLRPWHVYSTVAILALSIVATLLGFFWAGHYRDAEYFLPQTFGQDAVTLALGVPLLAVGLWFAMRGSLRGYVVWLGALGYMLYTWASYALMLYFNEFFLGYVALFGLSLYAFVGGILHLDPEAVRSRLDGRLHNRLMIAYLVGMGLFIAAGWLAEIVPATLDGTVPESVELAQMPTSVIYAMDLAVLLPAVLLVAVWLRHRRAWGYVFTGVLLVKFATLGLAVLAMEARSIQSGVGGEVGMMVVFAFIAFASAALGGRYLVNLADLDAAGRP
ncbi:MAG: hypothetical protein ACI9YT_001456 [Halobacteriales archaeon]|jgi:hypothetical protein